MQELEQLNQAEVDSSTVYPEALQRFYADLHSEDSSSLEAVFEHQDGRQEYLRILDREKITAKERLVVVKMHDDDEGMAAATIKKLADKGVAVYMFTLTNGDGRPRNGFTKEEVTKQRRIEAVQAAVELGAAGYFNFGYPDMEVGDRAADIKRTLVPYLRMIDPTMVFTLHPEDHNADHADGAKVVYETKYRSRNTFDIDRFPTIPISTSTPLPSLYYMDPQSLVDWKGEVIKPGMLVEMSKEDEGVVDRAMLSYATQYSSPADLLEFKGRVHERGRLLGKGRKAEGLTQVVGGAFNWKTNPVAEILGKEVHIVADSRSMRRKLARTRPVREG